MDPTAPYPAVCAACAAGTARLQQQVADLTAQLVAARAEIEGLQRRGKRQATPFSTSQCKAHPQRPGRKPGQGRCSRRLASDPAAVQAAIPVPSSTGGCPRCGGSLEELATEPVTQTDLPPPPRVTSAAGPLPT